MQEALAKNGRVRVASANLSEQPERHHAPPMTLPSRRATPLQVWLPFNKSLLLLVTTNLELARENPERCAIRLTLTS